MMELEKILSGINVISFTGDRKKVIGNITFDSRSVTSRLTVRGGKGFKE